MKTLEILEYVKEPKSALQLKQKFGSFMGCMQNLINKGSVRKYKGFNEDPISVYSKTVIDFYVATGEPYTSKKMNISPRREYHRQWYAKRKAEKQSENAG